jgi:transcriptional regulator with XRE-family HTH domain
MQMVYIDSNHCIGAREEADMELKIMRMRVGLNGRQAAAKLGINPNTLSAIETGRRSDHSAALVWRMARLYGVPVEALLEVLYGPAPELNQEGGAA